MNPFIKCISVAPTLDTSIYADGDRMGSIVTVDNSVRNTSGYAEVKSVTVLDTAKQKQPFDILVFDALPTVASADNAALDISDAEMAKCVAVIPILAGDYTNDLAASSLACKASVGIVLKSGVDSKSLYFVLRSRGTGTYAASSISIKINALEY